MALGNGAPDLFTTMSAARAGSGGMAIGELIGSASCIVSVVVGLIIIKIPSFKVERIPFLRELIFFAFTLALIIVAVLLGQVSRLFSLCLVGFYAVYVVTVMLTTLYEQRAKRYSRIVHRARRNYAPATEDVPPAITMRSTSNSSSSENRETGGGGGGGGHEADDEMEDGLEAEINELQYEWWRNHSRARNGSLLLAAEFQDFLEMLGDISQLRALASNQPQIWLNGPDDELRQHPPHEIWVPTTVTDTLSPRVQVSPETDSSIAEGFYSPRKSSSRFLRRHSRDMVDSSDETNPRPPSIRIMPATPHSEQYGYLHNFRSSSSPVPSTSNLSISHSMTPHLRQSATTKSDSDIPPIHLPKPQNVNSLVVEADNSDNYLSPDCHLPSRHTIDSSDLLSPTEGHDRFDSRFGALSPVTSCPTSRISTSSSTFYYHNIPPSRLKLWSRALLRSAIPTLHHWRSDTSLSSKAFLAFSSPPVLALTITVPVLENLPTLPPTILNSQVQAIDAILHGLTPQCSPNGLEPRTTISSTDEHPPDHISPRSTFSSDHENANLLSVLNGTGGLPSNISTRTVEACYPAKSYDPLVYNVPPEIVKGAEWCLTLVRCIIVPDVSVFGYELSYYWHATLDHGSGSHYRFGSNECWIDCRSEDPKLTSSYSTNSAGFFGVLLWAVMDIHYC